MASTMTASLATLPVELQLDILSRLPSKNIQRCRHISRHFKKVIDLEQNHTSLLGPSMGHSLSRLEGFLNKYCNFPLDKIDETGLPVGFLEAAMTFVAHRGINPSEITSLHGGPAWLVWSCFTTFWLHRCRAHFPPHHPWHLIEANDLPHVMTLMVRAWVQAHLPKLSRYENEVLRRLAAYPAIISETMLCGVDTVAQVDAIEDKIRAEPKLLAEARVFENGLPSRGEEASKLRAIVLEATGIIGRERQQDFLAGLLGVPTIPTAAPFVYWTEAEWVIRELKEAMASAQALEPIKRAAMLEKVMLF